MANELQDKVALITGGSKGIGLAIARRFAAEGAHVGIVSRSAENLAQARDVLAAEGLKVTTASADLSDPEQAEHAVAHIEAALGPVDILVNSAGAARQAEPEDLDPSRWRAAMDAKFFPYIHTQHAVLQRLSKRAAPGAIVNIIGNGGKQPSRTHLAGGSANAALLLSTVGLAAHYARQGIRINAINPGLTLTERVQQFAGLEAKRLGISEAEALQKIVAEIPMGRLGRPDEVAEVALFLASERASYVVGAVIPMHGGGQPVI